MTYSCPCCGYERPVGLIASIQAVVAGYYHIPATEMVSARRGRTIAWPRQVAMYLARELTPKSLPNIGRCFGGRDHTTVIHAIKAVETRMKDDINLVRDIAVIRGALEG